MSKISSVFFLVLIFFISVSTSTYATPPKANAGGEFWATKFVQIGHTSFKKVTLDGSKSFDPDDDPISYDWSLLSVPADSGAALITAGAPPSAPYFYADKAGDYKIQLIVNDGAEDSLPDIVGIEVKTENITEINWGNPQFDDGFCLLCITPSIAINDHGIVVEVHEELGELYYRVGEREAGGMIHWGGVHRYTIGHFPSVAINNNGVVVEAHEAASGTILYYKVGVVNATSKTIDFGSADNYTIGHFPSIDINDNNDVVEAHESATTSELYYKVGRVDASNKTISFGGAQKYTLGHTPSIALNNHGVVVETHAETVGTRLYYKAGLLDSTDKRIRSFSGASVYTHGYAPSVAINDHGTVIEVHQNKLLLPTTLYYKFGTHNGTSLQWHDATSYAAGGWLPAVSVNNLNQFVEINYNPAIDADFGSFYGLNYHATSAFMPVRNSTTWMEKTPSLMCRKLKESYLPGTHDSGAYEFFDGMYSPTYVPMLELISRLLLTFDLDFADEVLETLVQDFALAQAQTIEQQLKGGVRFLDLRIYLHEDDDFYIHHSAVGHRLEVILNDIRDYLTEGVNEGNPLGTVKKELLVVQGWVNSQNAENGFYAWDHARLLNLIREMLGDYLYEVPLDGGEGGVPYTDIDQAVEELLNTRIEDIVGDGPRVIFIYKDSGDNYLEDAAPELRNKFWPPFDFEDWANSAAVYEMHVNQFEALQCYLSGAVPPCEATDPPEPAPYLSKLFRLQYILTPQMTDFINYIISLVGISDFHPSLHSLSQAANQHLGVYVNQSQGDPPSTEKGTPLHFMTVDYYEESDVVARAIQLNQDDDIPPATSAEISPPPNTAGWNNTNITVLLEVENCPVDTGLNRIYYELTGAENEVGEIPGTLGQIPVSAEGVSELTYWSVDSNGNAESLQSLVISIDKTPPELDISTDPQMLWSPNHKPVDVTINGSATDAISGIASVTFNVTDEYRLIEPPILDFGDIIQLEASRKGQDKDGRSYTVSVTAVDVADNEASLSTEVIAPHDQR